MMNMNYQPNWPMPTDYYNQEASEYQQAYQQQLQMQNNYYVEQMPYMSVQSQVNVQQVYNQINHIGDPCSYMMDYQQQPLQLTTTNNRKARTSVSKSVKRQRQLRRNERERERQARLNSAFDVLRGSIPSFLAPYKHEQKLTQIETLRLAKYYISSLKGMLDDNELESCESDEESDIASEKSKQRSESSSSSDGSS